MAKPKAKKIEDEEVEAETVEAVEADEEDEAEPASPEEITPTQPPVASPAVDAAAPIGSKARAMKERLASQPKVRVFIPLAPGEKQGVTQSVILNGYPMYIRKGTYVEVPQAVAEVLETKLKHKMSIEAHPNRITGEGDIPMTRYGN